MPKLRDLSWRGMEGAWIFLPRGATEGQSWTSPPAVAQKLDTTASLPLR